MVSPVVIVCLCSNNLDFSVLFLYTLLCGRFSFLLTFLFLVVVHPYTLAVFGGQPGCFSFKTAIDCRFTFDSYYVVASRMFSSLNLRPAMS